MRRHVLVLPPLPGGGQLHDDRGMGEGQGGDARSEGEDFGHQVPLRVSYLRVPLQDSSCLERRHSEQCQVRPWSKPSAMALATGDAR